MVIASFAFRNDASFYTYPHSFSASPRGEEAVILGAEQSSQCSLMVLEYQEEMGDHECWSFLKTNCGLVGFCGL
jgi:hypothetical protein